MGFKIIFSLIFLLIAVSLMFFYFMPFNTIDFKPQTGNSNFSFIENSEMQFYPNLRFSKTDISYKIINCPLKKEDEMEYAFEIMENLTLLGFYPVISEELISVNCDDKDVMEKGLFVAGEGGPNITLIGNLNLISSGRILLRRNSDCANPNIALHELLHVLGFNHSKNSENIMYPVTDCNQEIGEDIINLINELYSIPSFPDLTIENASAIMNGRFLDLEITIRNFGLNDAGNSTLMIYTDDKFLKKVDLVEIKSGEGLTINLNNILVTQLRFDELNLEIESPFEEINKENNKIKLEIKNKA
jgi:hypothetical protein